MGVLVALCVICSAILLIVHYLANVPRERAQASLSYFQRVGFGADLTLKMLGASVGARDFGRDQSPLPLAEIYLPAHKIDELNKKLPESGRVFQKATVKLTDEKHKSSKVFKAKVRYRGDSINHWAMPQKSWRIQLRKDRLFGGRDTFNLYLPRTSSQVADYIGYTMGQRMGLLTPQAYPVHFRLNRRFDGSRVLLEQVDQSFLANRNLDPWYIFVGDINTNQIYGGEKRRLLFHSPKSWEVVAPNMDRGVADSDMGERKVLHQLSSILNRDRSPHDFVEQISKILDVESTLRYMALLDIVGSVHIDDTHNQKWYLNPRSGALTPIVWDTAAYMWGDLKPLSNPSNVLFQRLLQIPEFHARKNKIMWDAIHGPLKTEWLQNYVRSEAEKLKLDIEANPFKQTALLTELNFLSTEGWERGIQDLLSVTKERNNRILNEFSKSSLEVQLDGDAKRKTLTILPSGSGGISGKSIDISIRGATSATEVTLEREVNIDGQKSVQTESLVAVVDARQERARFALSERWYPWSAPRRMLKEESVPAMYRYVVKVKGPGAIGDIRELTAISEITGAQVPTAAGGESKNSPTSRGSGWWNRGDIIERQEVVLRGSVTLAEDLVLDRHQDLVVRPGTTIRMGPGVSIVVRGGALRAQGTLDAPIVIESADPTRTWGVIALQGVNSETPPLSVISNTTIKGGSYRYHGYAYYEAAVSVHAGSLQIRNASFDRSRVAVKDGDLSLQNAKFLSLNEQPVISVNSRVRRDQVNVEQLPLVHPVGIASTRGSGTSPREEREFRYGIFNSSHSQQGDSAAIEGDRIAEIVNNSLKEAVVDASFWEAPRFTKTPYKVSEYFETSVYRDIYIDSPEQVNYRNNISYRLRNRFKSLRVHNQHLKQPNHPGFWPYRSEFQAKVGRQNPESGLTVVQEGRFEFRKQSKPFSAEFPPPPPPWPLGELLPHMMLGTFFGEVTTPGRLASEYLQSVLPQSHGPVIYSPQVVVVTERRRQHLEIKTPWGTGPNPDQSFIITLDSSKIFDAGEYLQAVSSGEQGKRVTLPVEKGRLFELEMEFERNVSEGVAQALKVAIDSGNAVQVTEMQRVQEAFLRDQERITALIKEELASRSIRFEPVHKSKFVQAIDVLTSLGGENIVQKVTDGAPEL